MHIHVTSPAAGAAALPLSFQASSQNGVGICPHEFFVLHYSSIIIHYLRHSAGFNILRIGVLAYPAYLSVWNFLLSALVFTVFQIFIFGRLVKKHTTRIGGYEEERHFFMKFFDVKSFLIMAVMMSGGEKSY